MDNRKRQVVSSPIRTAFRVLSVLALINSLSSARAEDRRASEQYVGLSGRAGSYDDVQRDLAHFEWQTVEPTAAPAPLSLKELYEGQMGWRAALDNIDVTFKYSLERRRDSARVIAQKQQNRAVADNLTFEARVAMKGEKRFTHIQDLTPPPSPSVAGNAKAPLLPLRRGEFVYAYDGSAMKTFEPVRSVGHIHRAKVDAVDSRHMWYCDAISIPTGPNADKLSRSAWHIPTALSMPSLYRVLPALQKVDGFLCHVVTSGADTIWIDAEHGFAMRRRVWFQMSSLDGPRILDFIYVNKDFQQYGPIWLPSLCYRLDFAGTLEPENTHGLLVEVHSVVAKAIHVNTVPDELFELDFPGGTNVFDLVTNKAYVVPHGEHLLDEAVARANPIVNGTVQPYRSAAGSSTVWRQLLILNGVMFVVLVARLVWRRRRGSSDL